LEAEFVALEEVGAKAFGERKFEVERTVDVRYRGQGYELNVEHDDGVVERFHAMHEQRYGFANRARGLEIVNVRVRVKVRSERYAPVREEARSGDGSAAVRGEKLMYFDGAWVRARVFDRDGLRAGDVVEGPALVTEYTSATVLPVGARMVVNALRNLVIEVNG